MCVCARFSQSKTDIEPSQVEAVPEELVSNLLAKARGIFAWKRVA